jgi:exonuclease SbcC
VKLAQLLLQAFGPFTDEVINFAASPAKLHLIYGPNEAGKSSALRAMTDLRFGIHLRSADDFVHKPGDLRIGGVFIDDHGDPVGFVRRKGRGQTLSRLNTAKGQPDDSLPVLPDDERALTGGLDREEFERMFGLNHERLRRGGRQLLNGEGELGSTLFEASAGTRDIATILATLEADAKKVYNAHGRASNATINEARRQLDEHRQAWRQSQTKPAEWQTLNRAHETAKAKLEEVIQKLEALRRRDNEIAELRTVEPLLRDHDRVAAELESLADVPDLPDNAREERLAAEQALQRTNEDLEDAQLELGRCSEGLDQLVIEQPLLDHAEAIERLAAGVEAAGRSRIEVQQQQAVIERVQAEIASNTAQIASGKGIDQILASVPSLADRTELDGHLRKLTRLEERLDTYRARAEELEHASKAAEVHDTSVPDPASRQALVRALRQAQALGDVVQQLDQLQREIREQDARLHQAISDLGMVSLERLREVQPLLDAQILSARQELRAIDEAVRAAKDEDARLERDLEQPRLRHRELAAKGEVVTADTLRVSRERRDQGWVLVRQAYVERTQSAEELARAFNPRRPLPEAFEDAQDEADRQADLLRADAKRAAGFEELSARIEAMQTRREALATELSELAASRESLRASWSAQLAAAGLPELEVDALREWQVSRQAALEIAEQVERVRAEGGRLRIKANASATALATALHAVGETPQAGELSTLIEQAVQWEQRATETEAEQRARTKTEQDRCDEQKKVASQIAAAQAELERNGAAVQSWHVRLLLPTGSSPEAVRARLDELDALAKQATAWREARERQAHHRAVDDELALYAAQLARLLGEPKPELVDDFADRLRDRLGAAREQDEQRRVLERDRHKAEAIRHRSQAQIESLKATLAGLCSAAGVDSAEKLPDKEEAAGRKCQARKTLKGLGQQLAKASTRPIDELRERLAGQDSFAMDSERTEIRAEISRLEGEQASARQAEEQARRALEAVDTSDKAAIAREAMESATARYQAAILPWARLKLAHALLAEALNRFRERAQAPMVAAASTYFSLMTGGRYARLVTDDTGDKPVLLAETADGKRKGSEALSDGTADQLYLALRLAALDLRRESHPHMPLVLDDVLITSDDERAANVLRALGRFAEHGQVMLFTHHQHLMEVARAALGEQGLAIHRL